MTAPRIRPCRLATDARGSVTFIGLLTLTSVIGLAAFALELGQGYEAKAAWQGAADAAALGAANNYTSSRSDAVMIATARGIANANGVATDRVTVTHLTNYSATVSDAVRVVIRRTVPLYLARIFSSAPGYDVSIVSIASLSTRTTPACIMALASGGDGIVLSGGTRMNAPQCAIASNNGISAAGGSTISAKDMSASAGLGVDGGSTVSADTVTYGTATTVAAGSAINGRQVRKSNNVTDPLTGHAGLATARGRLGTRQTPAVPNVPTGDDLTLGYYPTTMTFQGRNAELVNGTWTFPPGTYNIRKLDTQSLTLNIQGPATVTVSKSVTVGGGGKFIVGDGPVSIAAPVALGGGTSMTLGAGRHYLGAVTIDGGSSMTLGAGDLDVNGAVRIDGGGSRMTAGAGNVVIGNNGPKVAINLSGGSELRFGDGKFSADGAITTSGGSTIVFGATADHQINGDLSLNGSSTFGAGLYTINGDFTNNTGGTMSGRDVTFILAGALNVSGGTSIDLSAPSASSGVGIADILFDTLSAKDTILGGGTQDVFSGAVHVPNSNFRMSGGASVTGACFMIVARSITMASGPATGTMCSSIAGSSAAGGNVTLIQ